MKTELSHRELVKLGRFYSKKGISLKKIEADFGEKGISRKAALKALDEIDYLNKKEALQAEREAEAKKIQSEKSASKSASGQPNQESGAKKSSFWAYLIVFLVLVGLVLFYYLYNNKF
ncbi:hypothetical protein J4204_06355 [Candidatus Woesearchaeota archaeon]|nr:hypothetical protein [Candidatus Woesearchaeota archaeon]